MNKLELAHEWAKSIGAETNLPLDILVDTCFDYAEAMLAENEKRQDKSRPEVLEEWQPDWSQAPDWAIAWTFDSSDPVWWSSTPSRESDAWMCDRRITYTCAQAPSFGYQGDWKDSLRKRP